MARLSARAVALLRPLSSPLFSLLFPDSCRLCDAPLQQVSRVPVCPACLDRVEPLTADYFCRACHTPFLTPYPLDEQQLCTVCRLGMRGYDRAYSFGFYEGPLRGLIHLLKYQGIDTLARPLGSYLNRALPRDEAFDLLVPVPMHWWRRYRRGYNQTELLAAELARSTRLPMLSVLRRCRATPPQAGLSRSARRRNVAGVFQVRRPEAVQGRHILLLDDVLTTGATASACAAALKRSGAARVSVLTLARADSRLTLPVEERRAISNAAGGSF